MCRLLASNRGQSIAMTMRELLPNIRSLSTRLSPRPEFPRGGRRSGPDRQAMRVPPLRPRVDIPFRDPGPDAEDTQRLHQRGQFLARQDDWETLAQEITAADTARARTPGLRSEATLLAEGARADIGAAVADAVACGDTAAVDDMLASLNDIREDNPECPTVAIVLALAHVDAARAWCGDLSRDAMSSTQRDGHAAHMAAAAALNDHFDPFEHDSPLWASVRCAVLDADPAPRTRVSDDYEDLIDLDPGNPHHLRSLGYDLRPARFGSWEMLDQQARRTAARTADVWGAGGYVWVYSGALSVDPGAFRRLDAELFAEGLHDILARNATQDMANRMAALTGFTLGGPTDPGSARRRLADCLGWIAQDHLREVHPMIWAEAPPPIHAALASQQEDSADDPLRRGRLRAVTSLTEFYAPALDAGRRLVFGPDGMRMIKGD
jgi:hypothetical protein